MSVPRDKVAVVTGSNVGIGLEVVKGLCREGWDVVMACRSQEKAISAVHVVSQDVPDAKVSFMQLDLSDLSSVRAFAAKFKESGKLLDALVNNAGVMMYTRQLTKDGFEMTIGTNHLGHFLLTLLLIDDITRAGAETGDARIINVSSAMQEDRSFGPQFKPLNFEDLMYSAKDSFNASQSYRDSKLMNVMFTLELARRLEGTGVTVNSIHPGTVTGTTIGKNLPACFRCLIVCCKPLMLCCGSLTTEQSAEILCDLVTSAQFKGVSGAYFHKAREAAPSKEAMSEDNQAMLWKKSAELVKLDLDSVQT